jgi:hypothetical protein
MHGQDVKFYKYLTPSSSIAALRNQTLKWSSPNLFDDPFEFPNEFHFSFSGEELAAALLDEIVSLAFGEQQPEVDPNHPFFAVLMEAWRNRRKSSKEQFRAYMGDSRRDIAVRLDFGKARLSAMYKAFKDNLAVFCVSKLHDDLLMWSQYTHYHTGCVLAFKCLPEYDRPLCTALEVQYREEYPLISDIRTYVRHLTGQVKIDYDSLFKMFAFTKSAHWSYEKEWRCVGMLKDKKTGYDFDPLMPEELEAVYLGCQIHPETEKEILELLNREYERTPVYRAMMAEQRYALEFKRIS